MNIGLDDKGERIRPFPLGRSRCQFCGAELIAKCGVFVDWHWAHSATRNCDPWHEHETPWHRAWKNRFPNDWHEVIHQDPSTGERHIADVKCLNGLILEFQNSPMSLDELQSREAFYGSMIWVVNVANQRERIRLSESQSDERVRLSIEVRRRRQIAETERETGKAETQGEIQQIDARKERLWYQLSTARTDMQRHEMTVTSLRDVASSLAEWTGVSYDLLPEAVRRQFNGSDFERSMKAKSVAIARLSKEVEQLEERTKRLVGFPKWNETTFSIVPYPQGKSAVDVWKEFKYLRTADGVFAEPVNFGSRTEFLQHAYRQDEHSYLLDLTERIAAIEKDLHEKQDLTATLVIEARRTLASAVEEKISFWEGERNRAEEICKPGGELEKEIEVVNLLLIGRRQSLEDHAAQFEFTMQRIDDDEAYVGSLIEDDFADILRYDWTRPKKVWYKSRVPVFLDTGTDWVYRIIDWRLVQRIEKEEFAENLKHSGIVPTIPSKLPARRSLWEERGW